IRTLPSMIAIVAGTAPASATVRSRVRARSRLRGRGMPWQIRVDSSATTARPASHARATAGARSISIGIGIRPARESRREECRGMVGRASAPAPSRAGADAGNCRMRDSIDRHSALIYTMVLVSAAEGRMTDAELAMMSTLVQTLPIFTDFDIDRL